MGPMASKVAPEKVSPVVAYLAHEDCPVTGEIYSVAGGRVARVFIAETPGFYKDGLTVEDVRDNFDTIRDEAGYSVPANLGEETALYLPYFRN